MIDDAAGVAERPSREETEEAQHPHEPRHDILDLSPNEEGSDDRGEGDGAETEAKPAGDGNDGKPTPKPPGKMVFVVVGLILVAALAWGGYTHWRDYRASSDTVAETNNSVVDVRTTEAKRDDKPIPLVLPGQTDAFDTASIYPRATGYIGERRVDIGSRVVKGDLLVHIVAPDLDQQLAQAEAQIGQTRAARVQAEAQVAQAEANVKLANVTFNRTNQLTQQGYETLQNRDNQQANVQSQQANVESAKAGIGVADANIKAQQATIDRLKALTAFEDVRAPFNGVVTSRSVDTGDLLNADTSTSTPMFTIARDDVVRVTVRVPQEEASGVVDGVSATVAVTQMPGRTFAGKVTRSSAALLYSSRTLTTEVDVPNPDGALKSGLYVLVTLQIPRTQPNVVVPDEALIFNQHGMQVATIDNDQVKIHQVTIYRDHGTTVDLKEGLQGGERIILSPPATLADGTKVKEHRVEDEKKPDDKQPGKTGNDDKQANANPSDPTKAKD